MLKTHLSQTLGKKLFAKELVRSLYKFVKLVTKTGSKVQKPKTYNESINNLSYVNKQQDVIDEKFWNLNFYQIWSYIALFLKWNTISYKWVF